MKSYSDAVAQALQALLLIYHALKQDILRFLYEKSPYADHALFLNTTNLFALV